MLSEREDYSHEAAAAWRLNSINVNATSVCHYCDDIIICRYFIQHVLSQHSSWFQVKASIMWSHKTSIHVQHSVIYPCNVALGTAPIAQCGLANTGLSSDLTDLTDILWRRRLLALTLAHTPPASWLKISTFCWREWHNIDLILATPDICKYPPSKYTKWPSTDWLIVLK